MFLWFELQILGPITTLEGTIRFSCPSNWFNVFRAIESHFRVFSLITVCGASGNFEPTKSFLPPDGASCSTVVPTRDKDVWPLPMFRHLSSKSNEPIRPRENALLKNCAPLPSKSYLGFTPSGNGGRSVIPGSWLVDWGDGSSPIVAPIEAIVVASLGVWGDNFFATPELWTFTFICPKSFPALDGDDNTSFLLALLLDNLLPSVRMKSGLHGDIVWRFNGERKLFREQLDIRETESRSFNPKSNWVFKKSTSFAAKSLHRSRINTSEITIRWANRRHGTKVLAESVMWSTRGSSRSNPSLRVVVSGFNGTTTAASGFSADTITCTKYKRIPKIEIQTYILIALTHF